MKPSRRAIGHLDIDGCDAVCTGHVSIDQAAAAARVVDEHARDDADRAELLAALGLTTSRRESPDA